ncbi:MAG: hypothetical protein WEB30_02080 [Cyclobacteriaceae bacterium]
MLSNNKKGDLFAEDAEAIISICEKIIDQHQNLGPASPLGMNIIACLSTRMSGAKDKHHEGLKYKKLMESAWRERDRFLVNGDKALMSDLTAIYNTLKEQDADVDVWGFKEE